MIKTTFAHHSSSAKTFVACLITSLMIVGPLAPFASAAPTILRATPANSSTQPVVPAVPNIVATKADSFPDLDADGKAAPGETITYDVNITNNGTDATGVNFNDTIDANTTLVGGSLKVSPLAFADTYSAAKDTPLSVGAPGVLTNDTGIPSPTAVAIAGGATAQGGTVTLNTNGSFLYNPPAGFTGTDTFTYTVTNGLTPNDTAQVSLVVDAPPSVTSTTPTNGASNQAVNTNISITFSEPVNVTGNWFQISCTSSGTRNVADTVVTGGPTTFTINPNADFAGNETCTVTVFAAQVNDQDANDPPDNMTADFVFSFQTTDTAPSVTSTTPTNGAVNQATNTNISVTFSEPVNVTGNWFQIVCTSSGTRNVADTVVTGGPTTFTVNPNVDFAAAETCTMTIFAAQVTDQDSNDPPDNMAANFVFSFTTESAPSVTSTTPTNGATTVANNTNVSITFSEPVNVTGNWFQIVGATSGTRNVADTVVTGGPTTFTINPNVDFANGELVTVTVFAAQVTDQDLIDPPDNMAANFSFSFTIDQAPSVTATTPTNGATNVALNSNLTVTFSEPVNVTGNWFQIVCPTTGTRNVADTVVTGGPTTFTINPNADFTFNETCTVTVFAAQVSDQDTGDPPDNMVANFVFSFTTVDAAPTVTSTTPTNGAVNQATNTNISVTFSEPVNVTGNWFQIVCTTSGTRNVADTVVTGGPTTFTINPNTDFTQGETCTVTVFAAQVTDQDTNDPPDNMAANFVFSFTMDQAPSVSATTPTNGATQQAGNTNITITFSEPVNVTGNWFQIVGATSGTRNVADTVVTGGPTTFTINPNVDFVSGELVTVTVFAAQVSDQDTGDPPDNMAANFVFSFTIDVAPSVTTTIPTNNATDVALNSTITINFSENVNVAAAGVVINCGSAVGFTPALPQNNLTTLVLTPTGGLPAGSNCTVTVDKTKISDTDTADPPDNMLNDFVFSFKVKPDAVNDTYPVTLVGNVSTNSFLIPFSVTTNDVSANAVTISAVQGNNTIVTNTITTTSVNGGNIVMTVSGADMGKFTYDPPAGFEGTDSFSYTISRVDGGGTDTATVNIPVSGMVWFINSSASSCLVAGCGRLSNPFSTLASFNTLNNGTGNNPAANDNIFIFTGAGNYTGPLSLLNNQKVIGQGATSSVSSITGLTPPTGSPSFPSTGGAKPSITTVATSGNNGINLASGNQLFGLAFSNTDGAAIRGSVNIGTATMSDIVINNTGGGGIILTNGGTVTISGTNTIVTTTGIALNVSNTNIGASGITFQSISANGASSGIILNTTGASGGLTITGGGNTSQGGDNSGGTIQNTTSHGISLNNTVNVSLNNLRINNTGDQGINGVLVNNFSFTFGTINNAGSVGSDENSITFDGGTKNISGTLTVTNSNLTLTDASGIHVEQSDGTLTNVVISNNTITSELGVTDPTPGSGIKLICNATTTTACSLPKATISNNTIGSATNAFNEAGLVIQANSVDSVSSLSCTLGIANDAANVINVTGNSFNGGGTGTAGDIGFQSDRFITAALNGKGTSNFNISNNGTVGSPIKNIDGVGIELSNFGAGTMSATVNSNVLSVNNGVGSAGIGIGCDSDSFAATTDNGTFNLVIDGNNVSKTDGPGIFAIARNSTCTLNVRISNNTAAAPVTTTSARAGIRVDSGSAAGDTSLCLDIHGNTTAGSTNSGTGTVSPGINLRKQGTTVGTNDFGIEGLPGAPTGTPNVENYVNSLNTSTSGTFGVGGTALLSGTNGFISCGSAPLRLARNDRYDSQQKFDVFSDLLNLPSTVGLTQQQLDSTVAAARARWMAVGLTTQQVAAMQKLRFEIADLAEGYLGEADGNLILVDRHAQGKGWFVDLTPADDAEFVNHFSPTRTSAIPSMSPAGLIDLLTALEHEIGHKLGLADTYGEQDRDKIMYGYLTVGERRVPSVGDAPKAPPQTVTGTHFLKLKEATPVITRQRQVNAMQDKKPRGGIVVKPTVLPLAGETVTHSVGTLLAGKTVHIQFQVTVNNPYGGGATVSNQGTVSGSNFSDVLTDDPAVGGANDPTTTPILLTPNISIADAQANEPSSGTNPMIFTVSLSAPAPAGGTSVHYQTADQAPGVGHAVAGVDYTAIPDTVLNFAAGEQFKTITVNILADGPGPEPDETFLVNLSTPTNGVIVDGQAVGTIKQGNAAGTFLISELRTSGPGGAGDDFVELYNNSDVALVVTASDASGGYGLFKMGADCNATPVLIGTIPNGTTIPARGHYLFVGSAYSLANYGGTNAAVGNQTLSFDIESDRNVGIFNTASLANLSSVTRLDAVGFGSNTGGTCDLLREGTTLTPLSGSVLDHSYVRDECGKKGNPATFGPCPTGGGVKDSNVNGDDFIFVDTTAAVTPAGQRLGAPGPQNLASPIQRNSTILALLLDSNIGGPAPPNRVRDLTPVTNGASGTMSIRRRFVNNTGAPVTRLRFRIVDISAISVPGGIADIRALTSGSVVVSGITDNGTCTAAGQSTPCTITVQGTTLETPPAQAMGGAHNSTMSAGSITLGTPLAPGASLNLQLLLGVQQTGSFKFFFNVEALP